MRRVLAVLLAVASWLGLAGTALHWAPWSPHLVMVLATFVPFAALGAVLCGVAGAALGRRSAVVPAALAALALAVAYAPLLAGSDRPDGPGLRVLVQNQEFGDADAQSTVDTVRREDVDVLATVETTPEEVARMKAAGLEEALPYSALSDRPQASGVTLWSRCPATGSERRPGFRLGVLVAELECPSGPVTVVVAHPVAPVAFDADPAGEADALVSLVADLPDDHPVLVAGDFNATWDHSRFRRLEQVGYRDSAATGGDGLVPTWPSNKALPPVIGIDHVLARGAAWTGHTRTVVTPGTDHRGLLADVVLSPADPASATGVPAPTPATGTAPPATPAAAVLPPLGQGTSTQGSSTPGTSTQDPADPPADGSTSLLPPPPPGPDLAGVLQAGGVAVPPGVDLGGLVVDVCAALDRGDAVRDVSSRLAERTGWTPDHQGYFLGAAVATSCPANVPKLN